MFRRRRWPVTPDPDDIVGVKWATVQPPICEQFKVRPVPADPELNCGVARNVINGAYASAGEYPLTGVRHPPMNGTSGWYVWAGDYSDADDFFVPVHTLHLEHYCPELVPYLALPPGWWIELAPGHEDAGYDTALLEP